MARVVIQALAVESSRGRRGGTDAIAAVCVLRDQLDVVVSADHRPRVARKRNDRKRPEHSVDGAALEAERTQMRTREEGLRHLEQARCGCARSVVGADARARARGGGRAARMPLWFLARLDRDDLELKLLRRYAQHSRTVTNRSQLCIKPRLVTIAS